MCTLLFSREKGRYAVAANRDEALNRRGTGPVWHRAGSLPAVWPLDQKAGGTWIGLNTAGVMAALTNRFWVTPDGSKATRGRLVPWALRYRRAAEALADLQQNLDPRSENGFHLLVADPTDAWLLIHRQTRFEILALPEGVTVVTERSFGEGEVLREKILREQIRALPTAAPGIVDLAPLLLRTEGGIDATTVHLPARNYGTLSRTLVQWTENRHDFLFASVFPNPAPYYGVPWAPSETGSLRNEV
ncbi:MAG: NRDE family protein [Myxococcota bacterium]